VPEIKNYKNYKIYGIISRSAGLARVRTKVAPEKATNIPLNN